MVGHSTIKTLVHYKDANGNDQYVELTGHTKTYQDGTDTMKRSDFLQSDQDLTVADKALLPDGMAIDYAHPTIKNSDQTYLNGYRNGMATFGEKVKYDFDGDSVIFEAAALEPLQKTAQIKRTIHYQYADGQKAADDVVQTSKEFTIHGARNPFTQEETWEKSTDSDDLAAVESPVIAGYTPDKVTVAKVKVTPDSEDFVETVTYKADAQRLDVTFIDDTTGQTLKTVTKTGPSGTSADYNTAKDIKDYQDAHYELVSDSTKSQNLIFDNDTNNDQHYVVHLKHATSETTRQDTVNETINYVFENGDKAAESYQAEPIVFTQTGTKDDVTGKITWQEVASQTFARHESPVIAGYTADIPVVDAQEVHFGDKDIVKTVTYKADAQRLDVTFIDDTTGQTLKTVTKIGVSDGDAEYNTANDIRTLTDGHYVLVSDSTNGANLVFDHDGSIDQHYVVHLKHQISSLTDTKTVSRTIHYIYTDGTPASDDVVQTATFTRSGQHDLVTNETTWEDWTEDQSFRQVISPKIDGYTASQDVVAGMTVTPASDDSVVTVVYSKNPEEHHDNGQPEQPGQPGQPSDKPAQPGQPQ